MKTARKSESYIHVRITPTPEINVKTLDLMREITKLVRERLGNTAYVEASASMNPTMMPFPR